RYFGVSNHSAVQIQLLKRYIRQPIILNQLELNLLHHHLIADGILVNQMGQQDSRSHGLLEYCRLEDIMIQAWSPVAGGQLFRVNPNDPTHIQKTAQLIEQLAKEKGTSKEAIAFAWLLRHPMGIQPIIGSRNPERIKASVLADDVSLSRQEWYSLLEAARGAGVP
ncbi:MAG: aldo/keto reductase, partial [Deinococcales bacterium]